MREFTNSTYSSSWVFCLDESVFSLPIEIRSLGCVHPQKDLECARPATRRASKSPVSDPTEVRSRLDLMVVCASCLRAIFEEPFMSERRVWAAILPKDAQTKSGPSCHVAKGRERTQPTPMCTDPRPKAVNPTETLHIPSKINVFTPSCKHRYTCVYMYIEMYICCILICLIQMRIDTHICIYICIYIPIHTYIYIYTCIHINKRVNMSVYVHTCAQRN